MTSERKKWADVEDDDDALNDEFEVSRADGNVAKVKYIEGQDGKFVKTYRIVREINKITKINKAVYERERWQKLYNEDIADAAIMVDENEFTFDYPKGVLCFREEAEDDEAFTGPQQTEVGMPLKSEIKKKFATLTKAVGQTAPKVEETAVVEKKDEPLKYKAPWQIRAEQGLPGSTADEMQQANKEECTVRVANLSEDVEESDLKKLFGQIGQIQRIFLAMHKETGCSKGFAFITYHKKEDARKAIKELNRHGYNNLLLTVECAKQTTRPRERVMGGGGGHPH